MNAPVCGNGMALGMTGATSTGFVDFGVRYVKASDGNNYLSPGKNILGSGIGVASSTMTGTLKSTSDGFSVGVTTNPTKSGMVVSLNDIDIGEINSMKLGKYILKY